MKKSIGRVLIIFLLILAPVISVLSQPPTPPGSPGVDDTYIGGVAIGGGLMILMALVMGYGARKLYNARKRKINE